MISMVSMICMIRILEHYFDHQLAAPSSESNNGDLFCLFILINTIPKIYKQLPIIMMITLIPKSTNNTIAHVGNEPFSHTPSSSSYQLVHDKHFVSLSHYSQPYLQAVHNLFSTKYPLAHVRHELLSEHDWQFATQAEQTAPSTNWPAGQPQYLLVLSSNGL